MSLRNKIEQQGFTIVELLIVIVVIGILAAITIVAYNGIQQRARNAQYVTDANTIVKKAEAFNADPSTTSGYPTTPSSFSGDLASLPANVAVVFTTSAATAVTTATSTTAPTTNTAITSALYTNTTTGVRTYTVKGCGSATGLQIFYPEGTTVKNMVAGTGC